MTTLSCDTKTWDKIRPSSVKKTGVSDAIDKALKAVPGGDPKKLADISACDKAKVALIDLIEKFTSAGVLVAKAKDDKKSAAETLKDWKSNAAKVLEEISASKDKLQDQAHEEMLAKLAKVLSGPRQALEQKVLDFCGEMKDIEQNLGHSKDMRQECFMHMSKRRGELQKQGMSGTEPANFLEDKDFKEAYDLWSDMVEVTIKATKRQENLQPKIAQVQKAILTLATQVEDAAKKAGDALKLDLPGIKAFNTFRSDVTEFTMEAASDQGRKYHTITMIPTLPHSGSVRAEQLKLLSQNFKRLGPDRAEQHFDEKMGEHGLQDKQLAKTISAFKLAREQAEKISSMLTSPPYDDKALKSLSMISEKLTTKIKQLQIGRTSKDTVQFLSKNEERIKDLDKKLLYLSTTAQEIEKITSKFL